MIEVEFYAPGLRNGDKLMSFGQQLDAHPEIRYKVDSNHDIVYFDFDEAGATTLSELRSFFRDAGLVPRLVGEKPEELADGRSSTTQKLANDTQKLGGGDTQRVDDRGAAI